MIGPPRKPVSELTALMVEERERTHAERFEWELNWRERIPGYGELEGRVPDYLIYQLFVIRAAKTMPYWTRTKKVSGQGNKTTREMQMMIMTALANGWDRRDSSAWLGLGPVERGRLFHEVRTGKAFTRVRAMIEAWSRLHGLVWDSMQFALAWGDAIKKAEPNLERHKLTRTPTLVRIGEWLERQLKPASPREIAAGTGLSSGTVRNELMWAWPPGLTGPETPVAVVRVGRGLYRVEKWDPDPAVM
ncbi:MAG TPA: hypothetical protein VGN17_25520 [Bryobacteraceae bacterium]|jgi:hypothetical protein